MKESKPEHTLPEDPMPWLMLSLVIALAVLGPLFGADSRYARRR
jgi:hypothetical protein